MAENEIEEIYIGQKFTVVHCLGAIESFEKALGHVKAKEAKTFRRSIPQQIKRLADGHRLSKENFPQEGDLPKKAGRTNAKKFSALKRKPLRGYCWMSEVNQNVYYISHYVFKNYDKLKESDTAIVGANWRRIEEDGDEK